MRFLLSSVIAIMAAAFGAEPALGTRIVHAGDGALMVYVPGGACVLGLDPAEAGTVATHLGYKNADELWAWDCYPRHTLSLDGFFIDMHETTVQRWKKFVEGTGYQSKSKETSRHFGDLLAQQFPAGEISWNEAKAYAKWAGKDLPTDAQWEKAARGSDGRLYPWGNEAPTTDRGHFGAKGKQPSLYVSVGSFAKGASPCGALDMLGNQYEWTSEFFESYPGNPQADRMKDYTGKKNVSLRGGSWYHGWISFYAAKRFGFEPDKTYYHVGFRTVWTPPAGYFESEQFRKDQAAAVPAAALAATPIYKVSVPPTIDGKLDDACWQQAVPIAADNIFGGDGKRSDPAPMTVRYAWDERYLYIAYDVTDTGLVTVGTGRENGPPGNRRPSSEEWAPEKNLDLVEFYISLGNERAFWEVHHTAENHLNNHWCEVPSAETLAGVANPSINNLAIHRDRFIPDDGAATVARAVQLKRKADGSASTVNKSDDVDAGYTGELRLPWAGLGVSANRRRADGSYDLTGVQMPLLAVVLNGNGGKAVYNSSARNLPKRMYHFSAGLWPRYVLIVKQ